jgi:translation machinery-associated protein 16
LAYLITASLTSTSYIKRDQDEIDQLQAERRPGRPASSRQDLLTQAQQTEQKEYESGFWVPDVQDELNLNVLREWSGNWGAMNQLKYSRVAKDGTVKDALFPPHNMK